MKNKSVKQVIMIPLLLILLLIMSISAYASGSIEFAADDIVTSAGETITVPISIIANSGFVSVSIEVTYDNEVLTLIDVIDTGLIKGAYHTTDYSEPYYLTWRDDNKSSNYTETGVMANLLFEVSESAEPGKYSLCLNVNEDGVLDNTGSSIDAVTTDSVIEIITQDCSHEWGEWVKSSSTKHKHSCKICGDSEYERHDWDTGDVTKEPTETSDGIMTYTCDICSGTKTETIPTLEPDEYDITGTVTSYGDAEEAVTVILYDADGTEIDSDTTTDGTYTLSAPDGTYTLEVSKTKHATREYSVTVDSDDITQNVEIWLYGDINKSGTVDGNDAAQLYRYVAGMKSAFTNGDAETIAYRLIVADVNRSSVVDGNDAAQLYRYVAGKKSAFNSIP